LDSVDFAVKKSRFDKNELLLTGCLDNESDLTELLLGIVMRVDTSSGRPHFLRCCLNSSSFSCVSRISRAINDSEKYPLAVVPELPVKESTPGRIICSVLFRRVLP
jgi:hypothetical protein